jgi:hypothetical protein
MWWKEKILCAEILCFLTEGKKSVIPCKGFGHKAHAEPESEEEGAAFGEVCLFAGTSFDVTEQIFLGIGQTGKEFPGTAVFQTVNIAAFLADGGRAVD